MLPIEETLKNIESMVHKKVTHWMVVPTKSVPLSCSPSGPIAMIRLSQEVQSTRTFQSFHLVATSKQWIDSGRN